VQETLLFIPVILGITIFSGMMIYSLFTIKSRPEKWLVIAILSLYAFFLYNLAFNYFPKIPPETTPLSLRTLWGFSNFLPVLFFHLGVRFLSIEKRRRHRHSIFFCYLAAFLACYLYLFSDSLLVGIDIRSVDGIHIMGPQLSPAAGLVSISFILLYTYTWFILTEQQRKRQHSYEVHRLNLLRHSIVWNIIFGGLNWIALALSRIYPEIIELTLFLTSISYGLLLVISVLMAVMMYRFRLPYLAANDREHLISSTLYLLIAISVAIPCILLERQYLAVRALPILFPPLLLGIMSGLFLVSPQSLPPILRLRNNGVTISNRPALLNWQQTLLSYQDQRNATRQVLRKLRSSLKSEFAFIALGEPQSLSERAPFQIQDIASAHASTPFQTGDNIAINLSEIDWPLISFAFMAQSDATFTPVFPPKLRHHFAVIAPISYTDHLIGILAIGHAQTGAMYSHKQTQSTLALADALSSFLQDSSHSTFIHPHSRNANPLLSAKQRTYSSNPASYTIKTIFIQTLGRFDVLLHGQSIRSHRLITRKALSLLACLVDASKTGLTRTQIHESIWPHLDVARARNAFNVTLHHLRRAFEPELMQPKDSAYFIYDEGRYHFSRNSQVLVDSDQLAAAMKTARAQLSAGDEQSHQVLHTAIEIYQGDYMNDADIELPGDIEITRQQIRFDLKQLCLRALQLTPPTHPYADSYCQALIRIDPWDLETYRQIASYYQQHDVPTQEKQYLQLLDERARLIQ